MFKKLLIFRFIVFRVKLVLYGLGLRRNKNIRLSQFFLNFSDAQVRTSGYNHPSLARILRQNAIELAQDSGKYTRDGKIFKTGEYVYSFLGILYAMNRTGRINVLDFGGALGSFYHQHLNYIGFNIDKWIVIEQPYVVEIANEFLSNKNLLFFSDLKFLPCERIDLIILSSVLPYLEDPFLVLHKLISYNPEYIFIDRTYFCEFSSCDFVMIQENSKSEVSYPVWIFNKLKFVEYFKNNDYYLTYEAISSFTFTDFASSRNLIFKYEKTIGN